MDAELEKIVLEEFGDTIRSDIPILVKNIESGCFTTSITNRNVSVRFEDHCIDYYIIKDGISDCLYIDIRIPFNLKPLNEEE